MILETKLANGRGIRPARAARAAEGAPRWSARDGFIVAAAPQSSAMNSGRETPLLRMLMASVSCQRTSP
jgi:transcription elongation factor